MIALDSKHRNTEVSGGVAEYCPNNVFAPNAESLLTCMPQAGQSQDGWKRPYPYYL